MQGGNNFNVYVHIFYFFQFFAPHSFSFTHLFTFYALCLVTHIQLCFGCQKVIGKWIRIMYYWKYVKKKKNGNNNNNMFHSNFPSKWAIVRSNRFQNTMLYVHNNMRYGWMMRFMHINHHTRLARINNIRKSNLWLKENWCSIYRSLTLSLFLAQVFFLFFVSSNELRNA